MNKKFTKLLTALVLLLFLTPPAWVMGQTYTWQKASSIQTGDVVALVYESSSIELSGISTTSTKYGLGTSYTTAPVGAYALTVVAGNANGYFAFQNGENYLQWASGNSLNIKSEIDDNSSWAVTFDNDGNAVIVCKKADGQNTRTIKYNTTSPRFACYTSGQSAVQLYKRVASTTPTITASPSSLTVPSYVEGTAEPDYETLTVSGSNLTDNITVSLDENSNFEMSTVLGEWLSSITIEQSEGSAEAEIAVRLKAGLSISDNYSGSITLSSEGASDVTVTLSGSVTPTVRTITYKANGPEAADVVANFYEGTTATIAANTFSYASHAFTKWNTAANGSGTDYEPGTTITGINADYVLYAQWVETNEVVDVLNRALTGVTGTSYSSWSGKTCEDGSDAVYAGLSAGGNSSIQLKSNDSNSGIISTTSGGKVKKVSVTWNSNTASGRTLNIYGSNTAYTSPTQLYGNNLVGELLGTIVYGTSTELTIDGEDDYLYIGLRSNSGAMYLEEIQITWEPITKYDITCSHTGNDGEIAASPTSAAAGTTITLTATPAEHYHLVSWTVLDDAAIEISTTTDATDPNKATFTMPNSDVEVDATFAEDLKYTITIATEVEDNILVDAEGNQAYEGDKVTVYVVAPQDKVLENLIIMDANDNEVEYSPEASSTVEEYYFEMPASNVTISATFADPTSFTVTYYVNGTMSSSEQVVEGAAANLPTESSLIPTGYSLVGWALANSTTAVADPYYPTGDVALHALLVDESAPLVSGYAKVTSAPEDWSGEYLIVYETGNVAFNGGLETLDAAGNTIAVTIADGMIESNATTDAATFTISAKTGGYSIISASGLYIGHTGSSNGLKTSNSDEYTNSISFNEDVLTISCNNYNLRYNSSSGQNRFRYFGSGQQAIQLYKKTAGEATVFTGIITIEEDTEYTNDIAANQQVVITNDAVVTFNRANNGTAANLIIEDGGQLVHTNAVKATLKKDVEGYGEGTSGWYTIASPVADANMSLATTGIYDLFAYDEPTHYWKNQKLEENGLNTFNANQGYLYANQEAQTLDFAGLMPATDGNLSVGLSYAAEGDLKGFNLVGNPFSRNLTGDDITLGGEALTSYLVVENGSELETRNIAESPIKPGQGFFVQATAEGQQLVFNPISEGKTAAKPAYITIEAGDDSFMDRAYIQIGSGNTLRKMTLGDTKAKLFVMHDGKDYAAATIAETQGELPVNFKAANNGTFTITVSTNGIEANHLHLIDNMTGADIDLLSTPSYTFNAKKSDYESRFRLVFSTTGIDENGASTGSATFAYYNGTEWVVNATENATLEVIDMTGRVIRRSDAVRNVSTNGLTAGVYMLRLTDGNGVKVQKIVVR